MRRRGRTTQLAIDKERLTLLRIASNSENFNQEATLSNQVINGTIADSIFTYKLPADAKEAKPGQAKSGA